MRVHFFSGDGLNATASELGYEALDWQVGDQVGVPSRDDQGDCYDYYKISRFEQDNGVAAIVYYSSNSHD